MSAVFFGSVGIGINTGIGGSGSETTLTETDFLLFIKRRKSLFIFWLIFLLRSISLVMYNFLHFLKDRLFPIWSIFYTIS